MLRLVGVGRNKRTRSRYFVTVVLESIPFVRLIEVF